mmetsp:Transcript_24983/g.52882  ORF Transcript_24983/g.52882 Transcript_24983/m.52882 type:complete len:223 (-) Transcript_24983:476-1144(-)
MRFKAAVFVRPFALATRCLIAFVFSSISFALRKVGKSPSQSISRLLHCFYLQRGCFLCCVQFPKLFLQKLMLLSRPRHGRLCFFASSSAFFSFCSHFFAFAIASLLVFSRIALAFATASCSAVFLPPDLLRRRAVEVGPPIVPPRFTLLPAAAAAVNVLADIAFAAEDAFAAAPALAALVLTMRIDIKLLLLVIIGYHGVGDIDCCCSCSCVIVCNAMVGGV